MELKNKPITHVIWKSEREVYQWLKNMPKCPVTGCDNHIVANKLVLCDICLKKLTIQQRHSFYDEIRTTGANDKIFRKYGLLH